MKKVRFLMIIVILTFAAMLGCDERQLRQADQFVQDANSVVTAVGGVVQSPAGALLPPVFQLYGAAGIALASIIVNGWQQIRGNLMKKTTKAIVKGVDKLDKKNNPNPTVGDVVVGDLKKAIGAEMRAAGIYDRGNQLVDQLKVAR